MADPYDLLTIDEAKEAIGRGNDVKDAAVTRLVTTASRKLDEAIGPVVSRTVTSERATGYGCHLELAYGPVTSIASVIEYQQATANTLTEETYSSTPSDSFVGMRYAPQPSLLSGVLIRRISGNNTNWWPGYGNVLVTYVAGRVASTTNVDAHHKEAAILMVRNLWRTYENSVGQVDAYDVPTISFPTFAFPNAVKEMLRDEWREPVGFGR